MKVKRNINILFDLDGTLIQSLPDIVGALNELRGQYGLASLPDESVRRHIGHGADRLIAGCFADKPHADIDALTDQYRTLYHENPCRGGYPYPGVLETLERLVELEIGIGVATNKPSLIAGICLKKYLPTIPFSVIVGPEMVTKNKPEPEHLWEAIAMLGVERDTVWYVGDDPVDARCAASAGVKFLGAGYGIGRVVVGEEQRLGQFSDLLGKLGIGPDDMV